MNPTPVDLEFLNLHVSKKSGFEFLTQAPSKECTDFARNIELRAKEAGLESGLRTRVGSRFLSEDKKVPLLPDCPDSATVFGAGRLYRIYFEYDNRLFYAKWVGSDWDEMPFGCSEVHIEINPDTILIVSHVVGNEPRFLRSVK